MMLRTVAELTLTDGNEARRLDATGTPSARYSSTSILNSARARGSTVSSNIVLQQPLRSTGVLADCDCYDYDFGKRILYHSFSHLYGQMPTVVKPCLER